jgi:hypothetical protein
MTENGNLMECFVIGPVTRVLDCRCTTKRALYFSNINHLGQGSFRSRQLFGLHYLITPSRDIEQWTEWKSDWISFCGPKNWLGRLAIDVYVVVESRPRKGRRLAEHKRIKRAGESKAPSRLPQVLLDGDEVEAPSTRENWGGFYQRGWFLDQHCHSSRKSFAIPELSFKIPIVIRTRFRGDLESDPPRKLWYRS